MSADDDIVFDGEVAYREPRKLRRPDFDRRFACLDYDIPGPEDLPIFLERKTADAIERHALRDTSVELGGILLGKECVDEETGSPFVWISEALEARHYENTQASFTYTHDSWEEITRERDKKHPELDIVGWYHTHPDFGIFLSGHDLFIHHNFFDQPLQVAYVVDPIRQTRGFFRWRGTEMAPVGGFTLLSDRADRQALARLVNDLEQIPNTESAGGAISPRLEAELIAMLQRPAYSTAASTERSMLVAAVPMICLVLGALVTAGVLWLNSLTQSLQQQTISVQELTKSFEKAGGSQASALDSERLKAREEVFDAILGDLRDRPGTVSPAARLNSSIAKLASDRAEANRKLANLETEKIALVDKQTSLRLETDNLKSQLSKAQDELKAKSLQISEDLTAADAKIKELMERVEDRDRILDETKGGQLNARYQAAWYTALAAILATIFLALGLVAALARSGPTSGSPSPPEFPGPPNGPDEPPRVVIS